MEALIAAKELKKGFGARTLFDCLNFAIHSGERIGLIGPNGAGKSTLLRLLADQLDPDAGEVVPRRGLRIAYLQQTPVLVPTKSILETIQEGALDAPEPVALALELYSKVGLDSLGRPPETPIGQLSGGSQKRTALARELARRPDLLLLDEPTNHLDIDGILWLETWLQRASFATVTVTHDRAFLQNVSNRILELDRRNPGGLLSVDGNYKRYLERKEELLDAQASREESLRNRLRRETEWLRRGAKARTTKQQARVHRANALGDEVAELAARNQISNVRLDFAGTERQTKRLIEAKAVAKGYGHPLFSKLDVFLGPGIRLGLLGPNGCGKSTLIRVLLGHEPTDRGTVIRADQLRVSYFEQNRKSLDTHSTVKTAVCPTGDHVKFQGRFLHVRSYLDRFLFAREQTDLPVAKLSGGEQARLLLARLMLEEADVLVLDEPTNDLDISTLDVLQICLEEFPGSVILVSHDRYFLDQVSTEMLAFTTDGVKKFADLAQWEAWRDSLKVPAVSAAVPATAEAPRKKRKLSYHETRDLETIEDRIHAAEARLVDLNRKAEEAAADASRLAEIFRELAAAQAEIDRLFERWQELEALKAALD